MSGKLGVTEDTVSTGIHNHSLAINVTVHDSIPDKRGISCLKKKAQTDSGPEPDTSNGLHSTYIVTL
jgi:hypothetical protein